MKFRLLARLCLPTTLADQNPTDTFTATSDIPAVQTVSEPTQCLPVYNVFQTQIRHNRHFQDFGATLLNNSIFIQLESYLIYLRDASSAEKKAAFGLADSATSEEVDQKIRDFETYMTFLKSCSPEAQAAYLENYKSEDIPLTPHLSPVTSNQPLVPTSQASTAVLFRSELPFDPSMI